ncbi:hypothetical protein LTR01_007865 [Friedmanniomyces endolithicus]|nr:hypothetical protein LTS09_010028 [Friedmanniomyces endolithicus]KAK0303779.1 hypothetical protein LTR01_007865 [Friedmanniomyces endolithicus]KAK0829461.1 hypothetical protein LTR73_004405 [Friedmanniomyces endolithicus]
MSEVEQQSVDLPAADDTQEIPKSPYNEENILSIKLHKEETITADVKILEQHGPSTYSTVLSVSVPGLLLGSTEPFVKAVLKVYDRRYAEELRQEHKVGPWCPAKERCYAEALASGRAAEFMWLLNTNDDVETPAEPWDEAQNEVLIQSWSNDLYNNEIRAYACLESLQGRQIPRFLSMVTVSRTPFAHVEGCGVDDNAFDIRGVLIEYIPGPSLENLAEQVPPEHWQYCVDQAVQIVRTYAHLPILNMDVKTRNVIVSPAAAGWDHARVVMIDFGLCRFRDSDESDAEWRFEKWVQDEEGAIGVVMRSRLKGRGSEITYAPSRRWHEHSDNEATAKTIEAETERSQARQDTLTRPI